MTFPSPMSTASPMPIFSKLLDVAEGLAYLHAKHATHGDLKGVGASSGSPPSILTAFH